MSAEKRDTDERARRKREDADVEAHGSKIDEPEENGADRRRKRRFSEQQDESEVGRRRR